MSLVIHLRHLNILVDRYIDHSGAERSGRKGGAHRSIVSSLQASIKQRMHHGSQMRCKRRRSNGRGKLRAVQSQYHVSLEDFQMQILQNYETNLSPMQSIVYSDSHIQIIIIPSRFSRSFYLMTYLINSQSQGTISCSIFCYFQFSISIYINITNSQL